MNDFPLVSIITPSFNQGRFIEKTIQSVLEQDYPNIEYIVMDGGSSDNTINILKRYENNLQWVSEVDKGQTDAINKGFLRAKGEILCWLNSDDTYAPGAIRKAVEHFVKHPDVMMVYGEGTEIDEQGHYIHRFPYTRKYDLWALIYIWDYILQPTTFFRADIFKKIDLPDVNLHWCMDWDLWIRIGSRFNVDYVDYVFANSRIHSATKTESGGMKRLREITSILRKYGKRRWPLGVFLYGVDSFETMCKQKSPILFCFIRIIFKFLRAMLAKIQYSYQGIYTDNWLGKRAHFMFPVLERLKSITLEMETLDVTSLLPNGFELQIGQDKRTYEISRPGVFALDIPVTERGSCPIEIDLLFKKHFKPTNDKRKLTSVLRKITLTYH